MPQEKQDPDIASSAPSRTATHDAKWLRAFRRRLTRWYGENSRRLPWRETQDPYAIWVSEIMLQQTQVATVIDYYHRFLERFPTVADLAHADEEEVMAMWAGLGYYRRARQLHAAAKEIQDEHDGVFPQDFAAVVALPGIGRYTAGAICSFAFGEARPILEANTVRLYSRLVALRDDPTTKYSQAQLWDFAEAILPTTSAKTTSDSRPEMQPRFINQAVMELGSLICKPTSPLCSKCPVVELCPTHKLGLEALIPLPKAKKVFTEQTHALIIVCKRGRYLLRCNQPGEWWEGLWDFPRSQVDFSIPTKVLMSTKGQRDAKVYLGVEQAMQSRFGLICDVREFANFLRHGVTRYRIQLNCFYADLDPSFRLPSLQGEWRWVSAKQLEAIPLTSTAKKLSKWLDQ